LGVPHRIEMRVTIDTLSRVPSAGHAVGGRGTVFVEGETQAKKELFTHIVHANARPDVRLSTSVS